MKAISLLTLAALGCGTMSYEPVSVLVDSNIELPETTEASLLRTLAVSINGSAATSWSGDPGCIVEDGFCELTLDTAILAWGYADLTVWLDVDGDDEGDIYEALADGDPIGFVTFDNRDVTPETELLVTLDDPVDAVEER